MNEPERGIGLRAEKLGGGEGGGGLSQGTMRSILRRLHLIIHQITVVR